MAKTFFPMRMTHTFQYPNVKPVSSSPTSHTTGSGAGESPKAPAAPSAPAAPTAR